jgi:hypothetical protein
MYISKQLFTRNFEISVTLFSIQWLRTILQLFRWILWMFVSNMTFIRFKFVKTIPEKCALFCQEIQAFRWKMLCLFLWRSGYVRNDAAWISTSCTLLSFSSMDIDRLGQVLFEMKVTIFKRVRKMFINVTISFIMSVRLFACNNSAPTGRIFITFYI